MKEIILLEENEFRELFKEVCPEDFRQYISEEEPVRKRLKSGQVVLGFESNGVQYLMCPHDFDKKEKL
jgi:hypothetical protein